MSCGALGEEGAASEQTATKNKTRGEVERRSRPRVSTQFSSETGRMEERHTHTHTHILTIGSSFSASLFHSKSAGKVWGYFLKVLSSVDITIRSTLGRLEVAATTPSLSRHNLTNSLRLRPPNLARPARPRGEGPRLCKYRLCISSMQITPLIDTHPRQSEAAIHGPGLTVHQWDEGGGGDWRPRGNKLHFS